MNATLPEFKIKTEVFEGPLDLLLSLVEKRKLFISDISLASVTDEYINHINQLPEYSMNDRTQFILIASTLLLIKAKSLLPNLSLTEDEKGSIEDLELRLRELEVMRRQSNEIRKIFGDNILFFQENSPEREVFFNPGADVKLNNVSEAIARVLNSLPKTEVPLPKLKVQKVVSLEEMMDSLTVRIKSAIKMSFSDFSGKGKVEKVNVIVSFLALLELVKQGTVDARQEGLFDEIQMESYHVGTPTYI
jgi:segregation and condensation protein A